MPASLAVYWSRRRSRIGFSIQWVNPFPPLQQTTFATVFSTLFINYTFNYREFSYFYENVFKVTCFRLFVCGKGLMWGECYWFPFFLHMIKWREKKARKETKLFLGVICQPNQNQGIFLTPFTNYSKFAADDFENM